MAVQLSAAAATLRASLAATIPAALDAMRRRDLPSTHGAADVRALLGEEAFQHAWASGSTRPLAELIDEALAMTPQRRQGATRDPATATPSHSLTPREVEVVRLIAAGKSNRDIAAELFLSIRTVERHIGNIHGKIHSHNKADVAAYAVRHDLA
jgi:DNA-binding NarL/FixJ family response regulator